MASITDIVWLSNLYFLRDSPEPLTSHSEYDVMIQTPDINSLQVLWRLIKDLHVTESLNCHLQKQNALQQILK